LRFKRYCVCRFSHLHTAEAGVCEIFSKSVEPLLDLCITGFNTSLLVVGESDAGREKLLMGDDNVRNGLLPILFAGLFAKIGDGKQRKAKHQQSPSLSNTYSVSRTN